MFEIEEEIKLVPIIAECQVDVTYYVNSNEIASEVAKLS
jgi:hypothetical protein